ASHTITCVAQSTWPNFHLVYWLANNSFIEDVFPDGRVREEPERQNANRTVEKSLVFSSTETKDYRIQFTCVIQDPSGIDVRNITLQKDLIMDRTPDQGSGALTMISDPSRQID
ncbi:hypothetical protein GDO86_004842, partial [Hymenochirus boettgeri]